MHALAQGEVPLTILRRGDACDEALYSEEGSYIMNCAFSTSTNQNKIKEFA
jgi:hypothetical protein